MMEYVTVNIANSLLMAISQIIRLLLPTGDTWQNVLMSIEFYSNNSLRLTSLGGDLRLR